jgi:hypothetical protein
MKSKLKKYTRDLLDAVEKPTAPDDPPPVVRKQLILRLYSDDRDRFTLKSRQDHLTCQSILEMLILEYLKNNTEINKLVKEFASKVNKKRNKRSPVSYSEMQAIMKRLEEEEKRKEKDEVNSILNQVD